MRLVARANTTAVDADALRQRVEAFDWWNYAIDLGGGVTTPVREPSSVNRHEQRRRYFFDALVRACDGGLAGKRVLDLGCNAGFWSLAAIEAGADHVHGVDGRSVHVEQATLVFEAKGVPHHRWSFEVADVLDLDRAPGTFDVVLCLGLLYHVDRPVDLLRLVASAQPEIAVVDTVITPHAAPLLSLVREDDTRPVDTIRSGLVMSPSAAAVHLMARTAGFPHVVTLAPTTFTDWTGADEYRTGYRRAFLLSRSPLVGMDVEPLPARDPRPLLIDRIRALANRLRRRRSGPAG